MAIWPLEHPKNALFSKIAPKQIYFWPYSIKGSWLEYQKPHVEDGHRPLAWRQKWRAVYGYFSTYQTDQPKPTNSKNLELLCFSSDLDEIWYGGY